MKIIKIVVAPTGYETLIRRAIKGAMTMGLIVCVILLVACAGSTEKTIESQEPETSTQVEAGNSSATQTGNVSHNLKVIAAETFLADIAQNVAGERLTVLALMPIGVDPHGFEPTPQDVVKVADSDVLIVNGAGFEVFLERLLENAGGKRLVIEAAAGLEKRSPQEGEGANQTHTDEEEGDPHFWLDPNNVIKYVENIQTGLSQADPDGAAIYAANAEAYIAQLKELDSWITAQVKTLPEQRRLLVTNHESFGYFADRYGFKLIGSIVPSISPTASPSAQQVVELVNHIKETGAPAIFLETGTNPQLAEQIAQEAGIQVVTNLYSHSITTTDGPAPTYLEMIRYNTKAIVNVLK